MTQKHAPVSSSAIGAPVFICPHCGSGNIRRWHKARWIEAQQCWKAAPLDIGFGCADCGESVPAAEAEDGAPPPARV